MGLDSISEINRIIKKLGNHFHFSLRPSLMYTTNIFKQNAVQKEYEFRKKNVTHEDDYGLKLYAYYI